MPALEPLVGLRVVADPAAIDGARWHGQRVTVLRFAPDDALGLDAVGVDVDDAHAIVESEVGFAGVWLSTREVIAHLEWSLPNETPALAQGLIAGVPAKLWLPDQHGDVLLLTAVAYADELAGRLR